MRATIVYVSICAAILLVACGTNELRRDNKSVAKDALSYLYGVSRPARPDLHSLSVDSASTDTSTVDCANSVSFLVSPNYVAIGDKIVEEKKLWVGICPEEITDIGEQRYIVAYERLDLLNDGESDFPPNSHLLLTYTDDKVANVLPLRRAVDWRLHLKTVEGNDEFTATHEQGTDSETALITRWRLQLRGDSLVRIRQLSPSDIR
jgi:hypothetical protein